MSNYTQKLIASFSTRNTGAGADINKKTGDIAVINDYGLFLYIQGENYKTKLIAPLNTRKGNASVSINHNTGEIAVIHRLGLNLYRPNVENYTESVLDRFDTLKSGADCVIHQSTSNIAVINDINGFSLHEKIGGSYIKRGIDNFSTWRSGASITVNQKAGDIFTVSDHIGGGPSTYPVPSPPNLPKGDCLVRYKPLSNGRYEKRIIDTPGTWESGADLDINDDTGELVLLADSGLYLYKSPDYQREQIDVIYTCKDGAGVKFSKSGEIIVVTDDRVQIYFRKGDNYSLPPQQIGIADTRNCSVGIDADENISKIAIVDNRGLTLYQKI